ncbi:MAG: peptidylprolyl isomerase [Acidobacteriota bacterium]
MPGHRPLLGALAVCLMLTPGLLARAGTETAEEAAPPAPASEIRLEIRGLYYQTGRPVRVRLSARNTGEDPVENPLGNPLAKGFELVDREGTAHTPVKPGAPAPKEQPAKLAPGAYFGQILDLTPYFPLLAREGTYTLTYHSKGRESNPVTLYVLPPFNPSSTYAAVIKTEFGDMKLDLFPDVAPLTVENFVNLAREGFYDGLTFHYIQPGEIIMGGDPRGNGTGSSGIFIPAEFSDRQHLVGTVGMVRGRDPNSASSQFYICLSPQPERDGRFTVFGQIVDGMDALNRLAAVKTSGREAKPYFRPQEPAIIQTILITETPAGGSESGS